MANKTIETHYQWSRNRGGGGGGGGGLSPLNLSIGGGPPIVEDSISVNRAVK